MAPATGSPDGATAVVVLSAAVHPPVVNFLVPDGIRIEATSDGALPPQPVSCWPATPVALSVDAANQAVRQPK